MGHYTIDCVTPRENPHVNYGLWGIMMSQCSFLDCNRCSTPVGDIGNGGLYPREGSQATYGHFLYSTQLCCEPETAIKN